VTELHKTKLKITKYPVAASYAGHVVFLADGRVVDEMPNPTAEKVLDRMKRLGD
jgi:putative ABC transport system ATP-binding protein